MSVALRVPADEIGLTFHASDRNGRPLIGLTQNDVRLLDNDTPETHFVLFESLQNLPIRAGFLFDSSNSMMKSLATNRAIIHLYASKLLTADTDLAFVMQFGTQTLMRQNWTADPNAIALGAARVGPPAYLYDPLTAIFDSLYTTCRDQFAEISGRPTGNFILIFSDGIDDASHAHLSEAVDMCQRTRTAIYAIVDARKASRSEGDQTLQQLTAQTGGRVFFHPRAAQVWDALQIIEEEQRNQYRLIYRPASFVADGSFHHIKLACDIKNSHIAARSGYYAFARP